MEIPAGLTTDSRAFDRSAMDSGIPSLLLMENASMSVFLEIKELVPRFDRVVVFAGGGGNGGDGLALLRILKDRIPEAELQLMLFGKFDATAADYSKNAAAFNFGILPESVKKLNSFDEISGKVLFVDAMVGTGLKSALRDEMSAAAEFINSYDADKKFVVSVDIPSGINSDTGEATGPAVRADLTVTMGIYKVGLFADAGAAHCGKVVLGRISATQKNNQKFQYFVEDDPKPLPHSIPVNGFKNRNGHLLVTGGDIDKIGATIIAAKSFMACGGGLVTAAFPKALHPQIAGIMPGMMLADTAVLGSEINRYTSIVIGPGLTKIPFDFNILKDFKGTVIVDAGMFDLMKSDERIGRVLAGLKVVFTPHQGELRRFLGADRDEPWVSLAARFPLEKEHVLVAKSHATFVRTPEKTVIVPHGAKALAFAGSGDSLTGIIACETLFHGLAKGAVNGVVRHRAAGLLLEDNFSATAHDIELLVKQIALTGRDEN